MYNASGGGGSRPPTSQMYDVRYTSSSSPRPQTAGSGRPYTAGSHQDPVPPSAPYLQRPSSKGSSQIPPPPIHPGVAFDLPEAGRRPSMPTPVYDRPSYSRGSSPAPYGYNDSQDDFRRQNYGSEETYPLTAYTQPMPPGTPYDSFEGDTGNT